MAKIKIPAFFHLAATFLLLTGICLADDQPSAPPSTPEAIPLTKLIDQTLDTNRHGTLHERQTVLLRLEQITQRRLKSLDEELRAISLKLYLDGTGMPGRLNAKELELSELIRRQLDLQYQAAMSQAQLKSEADMIQQGLTSAKVKDALARDPGISTKRQQIDEVEMEIASVSASDTPRLAALQKHRELLLRKFDDRESEVRNEASQMILQELTQSARHSATELDAVTKRIDSLKHDLGAIASTMNHYARMQTEEKSLQSRLQQIHDELDVIAAVQGDTNASTPPSTEPAAR